MEIETKLHAFLFTDQLNNNGPPNIIYIQICNTVKQDWPSFLWTQLLRHGWQKGITSISNIFFSGPIRIIWRTLWEIWSPKIKFLQIRHSVQEYIVSFPILPADYATDKLLFISPCLISLLRNHICNISPPVAARSQATLGEWPWRKVERGPVGDSTKVASLFHYHVFRLILQYLEFPNPVCAIFGFSDETRLCKTKAHVALSEPSPLCLPDGYYYSSGRNSHHPDSADGLVTSCFS